MGVSVECARVWRKVAKRDKRISGLQDRIALLETALATKSIESRRLPIDVARAVQDALSNVRLLPVLGVGKTDKIVEIRGMDDDKVR